MGNYSIKNEKVHTLKYVPSENKGIPGHLPFPGKLLKIGSDEPVEKLYSGNGIGFAAKLADKKEHYDTQSLLDAVERLRRMPREKMSDPGIVRVVEDLLAATNSALEAEHGRKDRITELLARAAVLEQFAKPD